ncbi:uncharacterized protein EV420DRAFT_972512 [Desarmillaria tabescens]|uniref:DUF6535 domain-containing protein n=1 Tax=Armillaria tabescens TaxID=1929756 RepID=A0AA39JM65_ARMTA|nr:uncharacterized protein EV420DRAFT_972512 [Desarmillaria tabescens]KAK0445326.1 hypothetical protein EV420DRAFT_972512 [Desarmillaria tabescens]
MTSYVVMSHPLDHAHGATESEPLRASMPPSWGLSSPLDSPTDPPDSALNSDSGTSPVPPHGSIPFSGPFQSARNPSVANLPSPPPPQLSQILHGSPFYFHGLPQNTSNISGAPVSPTFDAYLTPEPSHSFPQDTSKQKVSDTPIGSMLYGHAPSLDTPQAIPSAAPNHVELLKIKSGVRTVQDDYEQKYPEDSPGSECDPTARIWRIFADECQAYDKGKIEVLRDNVDVLLVFAGLFSAVVTTFVAQTSQSLQVDYSEMSAFLLYEMVNIQRAIASGVAVDSVSASPLNPTTIFIPSASDRYVNGLWFTSLSLSLVTALVAVLAKQWIRQYMLASSETPRDRCRIRQFRYTGFQDWHVPIIIGILPFLLHIALAIFLAGLVVFLLDLEQSTAYVLLVITGGSYALYLAALLMPLFFPGCPYQTSLTDLFFVAHKKILGWTSMARYKLRPPSIQEWELQTIKNQCDDLDVHSLRWLYDMSSNPVIHRCIIQCIGGLQPSIKPDVLHTAFEGTGIEERNWEILQECLEPHSYPGYSAVINGMETQLERLLRSRLRFSAEVPRSHPSTIPRLLLTLTPDSQLSFEITTMTATIACQDDELRPRNHPTGADVFLYLTRQADTENILLHPSLWRSLFSNVISRRSLALDSFHNSEFEPFCYKFMETLTRQKLSWNPAQPQDDGTRRMSLQDALRFGLYDDIETHLLDVLAKFDGLSEPGSFDDHPHESEISRRIRLLLAITNYALSTQSFRAVRWDDPSLIQHHCFGMVFFALRELRIHLTDYAMLSFRESAAIYSIICPLVTSQSFASKEKCPSPILWMIRSDVIRILVRIIIPESSNLEPSMSWGILPPEWSNVRDVICGLTLNPNTRGNWLMDNYVPANCVIDAGTLLEHNMDNDDATAVETFTTLDVLQFAEQTMFIYPWCRVIQAYISAICRMLDRRRSKTSHPARIPTPVDAYIDYIHCPQNLYTICAILGGRLSKCTEKGGTGGAQKTLNALAGLRPQDPAWSLCIVKLERLFKNQQYISEQQFFSLHDAQWRPYDMREVQHIMIRLEISVAKLKQVVEYSVPAPDDAVFAEDLQPSTITDDSPMAYIPDDSDEYASQPSALDTPDSELLSV